MDIGAEIRAEMARKKLTGVSIAQKIGISRQALSSKLSGNHDFSSTELFKISDALNVKTSELLRRAEEAEKSCPHND